MDANSEQESRRIRRDMERLRDAIDYLRTCHDINDAEATMRSIERAVAEYRGPDKTSLSSTCNDVYERLMDRKETIFRREILGEDQDEIAGYLLRQILVEQVQENPDRALESQRRRSFQRNLGLPLAEEGFGHNQENAPRALGQELCDHEAGLYCFT